MSIAALKKTFDPAAIPTAINTVEDARIVRKIYHTLTKGFSLAKNLTFACEEYNGDILAANGMTGPFRHRGVMNLLTRSLIQASIDNTQPIRIFAGPSSIALETNAFSAIAIATGLTKTRKVQIDTFDRSKVFTALARIGAYPVEFTHVNDPHENELIFETTQESMGMIPVRKEVIANTNIMNARSFEDFVPEKHYDVMMLNNLYWYMDAEQQAQATNIIRNARPEIVIVSNDDKTPPDILEQPDYLPFKDHPVWGQTKLALIKPMHERYYIWARSKTGANYAP